MKQLTTIALALCLLASACDDDDPEPAAVGAVINADPLTEQDGVEVFGGEDLFEEDLLETDDGGKADFEVDLGPTDCTIGPDSGAIVRPSSTQILKVTAAPSTNPLICAIGGKADQEFEAGDVVVTSSDPIVSFVLEGTVTTVKSHLGFLLVTSLSTGQSASVGPQRQVSVPFEEPPQEVQPIEVTEFEQIQLPRLFDFVTPVDPFDIDVGESLTLAQLFETGTFNVLVDAQAAERQPGVVDFVEALTVLFGERLEVEFTFETNDRDEALSLLLDEQTDAVLTPMRFSGMDAAGLFTDSEGVVWELNVDADGQFGERFSELLAVLLADGEFDNLHGAFFDLPLDYGATLSSHLR